LLARLGGSVWFHDHTGEIKMSISVGTLSSHHVTLYEKNAGHPFIEVAKTGESANLLIGRLANQKTAIDMKLGGPDAVIDWGTAPGFAFYHGTVTPSPSGKPIVRRPHLHIKPATELIVVGVPDAAGTASTETIAYFGNDGNSVQATIPAAYSVSGSDEVQVATTKETYIRVILTTGGKYKFADSSAQAIPASVVDPIRIYYDEVTKRAQDAGIDA
jgi:hypothetical protein